ncbi:MAK10-like protein [Tanacetum coccineum]|uniref:MAK10-like protein n=1 Tax=Tanacetum coccineum TaxID=301880 RepID=A0ABQ4X8S2_9ASTR
MVPLRSDTIWLIQNEYSFHGLRSEDPNQHLKDFLKLVDSLDLDGENRERMRLRLFQFSLRDQASNWLERLPAGSISTWEDLTTRFLAQFFPPRRTAKLRNDILMFQQHHGESLSEAWTRFKDLLQKVPHHGIDLWLQLRDLNPEESWAILEDLALYDNESWNDPRDFAKPVKAITLPQDVPSTSDRRLIELENQVQRLMEAHLASTQPTQVKKITTLYEICSGPHDTQNCIKNPEQAFVDYASSRYDKAGEGLVFEFMASQDARLSKFKADFKRQQGEMTNKIDIVLKAIIDQIAGTLPSDTVKNPKLGTYPVSSACSYPIMDPQCSTKIHSSINAITIHLKQLDESQVNKPDVEQVEDNPGETNSSPHPQPDLLASIATEHEDNEEVMFIEIIQDDDEPQNEDPNEGEGATTKEIVVEYFDNEWPNPFNIS